MLESEYFDFSFSILKDKPCFKISLKKEFLKKEKPFFISENGKRIPISSSSEKYFHYYFKDEEIAKKLYSFRKKYFNIEYCVSFWVGNCNPKKEDLDFCNEYLKKIKQKERENYNLAVEKESYKQNLARSRAGATEKIKAAAKKRFENAEYKEKVVSVLHSNESKEKRIKSFLETMNKKEVKDNFIAAVNNPARLMKISLKSKERWRNLPPEERESRIKSLRYKKKFSLNGYKMNLNEFIVGSILTELSEDWVYEHETRFDYNAYYPDFKIELKKIIIECYGTFWHADPRLFSPDHVVMSNVLAKDIWEKDQKRINNLKSLGYNIIVIWEQDIHQSRDELRSIIKKAIGAQNEFC
jgi:hypothetical protein